MKLLRDEMERTEDADPLDLFNQGIRTEATRYRYTTTLQQVLCVFLEEILEGDFEERVAQLVRYGREEPEWTRDLLIKLARKLRDRTRLARDHPDYLNPTTIPMYFKPIKKLFDMNDVAISWKRIYATYPELDNMADTAGWSREEIAGMIRRARDTQARAMILLLASSGVRVGALPDLNWGDLTPVYRVDDRLTLDPGEESGEVACVALEVYRGSSENYTTFITPEAFAALQEYGREWSEAMGRQANSKDPMWISTKGVPKRATYSGVQKRLDRVVWRSGLRDDGKENRRYRVPLMHGFRRFFNKTIKDAPTPDTEGSRIRTEYMMGHQGVGPMDKHYYKITPLELAKEYVLAVPDLTIDDADRLRRSNRRMADNVRRVEDEKEGAMARMQEVVARLEAEISSMKRASEEKDEKMERLARERDELAARTGSEKDEEVARLREEVAEVKRRRGMPAEELLAMLRGSSGTDGVSGTLLESLTGMVRQMGAAQEASIMELRREYDAEISKLKRRVDGAGRPEGAAAD